jgi:hypothetical protein
MQWKARSQDANQGNSQVGHGDYVTRIEVLPLVVAPVVPFRRWRWLPGISVEPLLDDIMVESLGPKHSGEGLPRNAGSLGGNLGGDDRGGLGILDIGIEIAILVEYARIDELVFDLEFAAGCVLASAAWSSGNDSQALPPGLESSRTVPHARSLKYGPQRFQ